MWSSDNPLEHALLAFNDRLEDREYALLIWGFVNVAFTPNELKDIANEIILIEQVDTTAAEMRDMLLVRRMLIEVPDGRGNRAFRARFAEAVRLFAGLRQIMRVPQGKEVPWQSAPRLVADYRILVRARRYPPRTIGLLEAIERISLRRTLEPLEQRAFGTLIGDGRGGHLKLARFQVDATSHILAGMGQQWSAGTIVSAGTGTGKTLAFYVPCLMSIARLMSKDDFWVQAVAIYPRNELLKDQFSEAFVRARLLDALTLETKRRKIRIGAYFGPTPLQPTVAAVAQKWEHSGNSYVCPFLRCPQTDCEGELLWSESDIAARPSRERLRCKRCDHEVPEGEIALTRQSMQDRPPDVLFTTTEMLNRNMSSTWVANVFGIRQARNRAPYLMLLDEVHTYDDTHGAHAGLLIRRWREAVQHPIHFVGLSATLADPQNFFADLVGLPGSTVASVTVGDELINESREYQLILRGDPVSGTSLLATTIQAAMLMGRIMDPMDHSPSGNAYGSKIFAFTDDLDVTNRLYDDLRDAEGLNQWNKPIKTPLAFYRSQISNHFDYHQRLIEAQGWKLCDWIGHHLSGPDSSLRIGRTSSQDIGVDAGSNVVVATASLEVGYNDPHVGGVIQHKAPRDSAAFLQRKGRAGRVRIMRPWTVVILSDYGRDRLAHQAYEQLFDPVFDRPVLPTSNRYVLKIQATYALMDWLVTQLPVGQRFSVWDDLTRPATNDYSARSQEKIADIVSRVIEVPAARHALAKYLQEALHISPDVVKALFWEPPRALITAVLPTILRRLKSQWRRLTSVGGTSDSGDIRAKYSPLPDFVPDNLFSDLMVPDVSIVTPGQIARAGGNEPDSHLMPLRQAISTVAPGRVTRRFAERMGVAHWVPPADLEALEQTLDVRAICHRYEELTPIIIGEDQPLRLFLPLEILVQLSPENVKVSSNARLEWCSEFSTPTGGFHSQLPHSHPFSELITGVIFHTHNQRHPLRTKRFAVGSSATLRFRGGAEHDTRIRFTDGLDGPPAALGFEQEVDAMVFEFRFTDEMLAQIRGDCMPCLRTSYLRHLITTDTTLRSLANSFRLDWLAQIYVAIVLARTLAMDSQGKDSLREAIDFFATKDDWGKYVRRVLSIMFNVDMAEGGEEDDADGEQEDYEGSLEGEDTHWRVHAAVLDLVGLKVVRDRLSELASVLWHAGDGTWDDWLRSRLATTLGSALLQAVYHTAPQFNTGGLLVDIVFSTTSTGAIYISEDTTGGTGMVEEVLRRYTDDPRRFFLLAESALGPSELEIVDRELTRLMRILGDDELLQEAFRAVREAEGNSELLAAQGALTAALRSQGVLVSHAIMTSLNARVLRPGSSGETDDLLRELITRWQQKQHDLGIDIDARVFTYLAATLPEIGERLKSIIDTVVDGEDSHQTLIQRFSTIYGLLWPRGTLIREQSAGIYNPFSTLLPGDNILLRRIMAGSIVNVDVTQQNWRVQAESALVRTGSVRLAAMGDSRKPLSGAILGLIGDAIDTGLLILYPYVVGVEDTTDGWAATLYLKEAVQ